MRHFGVPLLALFLNACSSLITGPEATGAASEMLALAWQVKGRVAVRTQDSADSATLLWRQENTDFELLLSGPLGVKTTSLQRRDGRITLTQGSQQIELDPDKPENIPGLVWRMPIDSMSWWLRGLPDPALPEQSTRAGERLLELQQRGWHLQYTDYQTVDGYDLPRRILFARDAVSGKLLLKDWTLHP